MSRSRDYVDGVPSEIAERFLRKKRVEPLPTQLKRILKVERVEVTIKLNCGECLFSGQCDRNYEDCQYNPINQ